MTTDIAASVRPCEHSDAGRILLAVFDDYRIGIVDGTTLLDVEKSNWATKLDTPPYSAYAVTCGITFTFGGLRIDEQARVISHDGDPISGLTAAGELVGGLFYHNYPGGSGLTAGTVFGRIAGATATGADSPK